MLKNSFLSPSLKVAGQPLRWYQRLRILTREYTQLDLLCSRHICTDPIPKRNLEEANNNLQDFISQGLQELLDYPNLSSLVSWEAYPPISQEILYPI